MNHKRDEDIKRTNERTNILPMLKYKIKWIQDVGRIQTERHAKLKKLQTTWMKKKGRP
jgi:hypothetical protein